MRSLFINYSIAKEENFVNKLNLDIDERLANIKEVPLLLSEAEAAKLLGVSVSFLRKGRMEGQIGQRTPPPPHVELGKRRLYRADSLRVWLDSLAEKQAI